MRPSSLRVLLTAVGCPGGATMIHALKRNGERDLEVIGTDMRSEASGRFLSDRFYTVPPGDSAEFVPRLIEIVEREQPHLLFPQSTYEVYPIALHRAEFDRRGVPVLVAKPRTIEISNDKGLLFAALAGTGVPCPSVKPCSSLSTFIDAVRALGYPERPVCFKPAISKAWRGFRILSAGTNRVDMLVNRRVEDTTMTLEETADILKEANPFPALVVMEYVAGEEASVDVFCREGRVLLGFTKTRGDFKAGLAMYGATVERPDLRTYGEEVARVLELDYFANIQFKGDKLLEVNPRVSTFVHQEDFNMPYLGCKYLLGEIGEEELHEAEKRVRTTRRTVRFYDQLFYDVQYG